MEAIKQKIGDFVHPSRTQATTQKQAQCRSTTDKCVALVWHSKGNVSLDTVGKPMISDPRDVLIRVTGTSICGSDIQLFQNKGFTSDMLSDGDILGHEAIGFVECTGTEVKNFKVGDRVVVSCSIACGTCTYCTKGNYSCCEMTNPCKTDKLSGHRTAGLFGFSRLTGGCEGCQAEYVRVPFADVNCFKIPDDLSDEKAILLSDVLCTGYHGCELAKVKEGDTVGIWGCGPDGLACQAICKLRGANVVAIDRCDYRLALSKSKFGSHTINFSTEVVMDTVLKAYPNGLDSCIDCAGFRCPTSTMEKIEKAISEAEPLDILNEMVNCCKRNGRIALIGDYIKFGDRFPIGPFMDKCLTMKGGQVVTQQYFNTLLECMRTGKLDPSFLVTHTLPFTKAPDAYKMSMNQEDYCLKILLKPQSGMPLSR